MNTRIDSAIRLLNDDSFTWDDAGHTTWFGSVRFIGLRILFGRKPLRGCPPPTVTAAATVFLGEGVFFVHGIFAKWFCKHGTGKFSLWPSPPESACGGMLWSQPSARSVWRKNAPIVVEVTELAARSIAAPEERVSKFVEKPYPGNGGCLKAQRSKVEVNANSCRNSNVFGLCVIVEQGLSSRLNNEYTCTRVHPHETQTASESCSVHGTRAGFARFRRF